MTGGLARFAALQAIHREFIQSMVEMPMFRPVGKNVGQTFDHAIHLG
jgi:hypothetical protein